MQKQTEIPQEGGQDPWDANWKIGSLYKWATSKPAECQVPLRPVLAYCGSQMRRVLCITLLLDWWS